MYSLHVSWLLIKFSVPHAYVPALSDALEDCDALSITIESATDEQRLQSALEETALWSENQVAGLFPEDKDIDEVLDTVRTALGRVDIPPHEVATLPDADWARAWMADYKPVQVGPRLWVCPSWCTPPDPHAINLLLDPGLAFGTGTHPTTALCLRWLTEQRWDRRRFLDYGCGSGILAIAALKLGAQEATGIDIDPQALGASRENAVRNGVAARFSACAPEHLPARFSVDVLVANILAAPLIELASRIAGWVKPGGWMALSGVLTDQAEEVRQHYAPYVALQSVQQDGWVLLAGQRLF